MKWVLQIRKWLQTVIRRANGLVGVCWCGCFAWKEMFCSWVIPGKGSHVLGRLAPLTPPQFSPQTSSSLPLIYTAFPKGFTRSWYTRCHPSWEVIPNLDKNLPPCTPIGSMCNLRGSPLQGMETDHWFWLQRANRCGSVPHKLPLTLPETPRRGLTPHMCTHKHTHTPMAGWVGLLFFEKTGSIMAVNISAFIGLFLSFWCNVLIMILPSHADRIKQVPVKAL